MEYAENLSRNRTFIAGDSNFAERELCELSIVHPVSGETFRVAAEAVWIQPGSGVGLALLLDGEQRNALAAFIDSANPKVAASPPPKPAEPAPVEPFAQTERPPPPSEPQDEESAARNLYDRVRELKSHERDVMARHGSLAERVALERCFQGAVWEALLGNSQLTVAEVARIAKNPGLPGPLVSTIAGNSAWIGKAEVQRALLTNPRLTGLALDRVLKAVPKGDLATIATSAAHRAPVRQAAKKLLGV